MAKRKERKLPRPGTRFSRTYKGETYTMEVVSQEGRIGYKVGQEIYSSPTAAAGVITDTTVNGWKFWGLDK